MQAQTITHSETYTITSVKLLLSQYVQSPTVLVPGTIEARIFAVDGLNRPTGSKLTTTTSNGDTLPAYNSAGSGENDDPFNEWREFIFSPAVTLTKDVTYAIVLSFNGAPKANDDRNLLWWRNSNLYTEGGSNAGLSFYPVDPTESEWGLPHPTIDFLFETYGFIPNFSWPPDAGGDNGRPVDYDPDEYFDPETQGWTSDPTDLTTLGGGRYNQQIVVVGNKKIYFGGLS